MQAVVILGYCVSFEDIPFAVPHNLCQGGSIETITYAVVAQKLMFHYFFPLGGRQKCSSLFTHLSICLNVTDDICLDTGAAQYCSLDTSRCGEYSHKTNQPDK